jgi:DNA (cytosine-5)-methyltransferase 1
MTIERFLRSDGIVTRELVVGGLSAITAVEDVADSQLDPASAWWQSFLRGASVFMSGHPRGALNVVDAFCGTGGLSLGACLAAISAGLSPRVTAAIDMDPDALSVYARNLLPATTVAKNVDALVDYHVLSSGPSSRFAYEPEILDERLARLVGKTDLFLAGPPCEGHSNFNNRTRRLDPRNRLYISAVALAIALQARAVIIENVPDVTNDKGSVVEAAVKLLESAGYSFRSTAVLSAHELGGPQTRRRFFLVAAKKDGASLPEIRELLKGPPRPVSWAIGDLLQVEKAIPLFDESPTLTQENQRRIDWLFDNDEFNLPNSERPDCHKNGHTYPSVYGRLWWDRPSQTITTGFLTPGRGRYIHPLQPRVITPHEAARLQCFPDSFYFFADDAATSSRKQLAKLIGDAVPPLMGVAATLSALPAL